MNIAFLEPLGNHGGLDTYNYHFCTAISASGEITVTLYTSYNTMIDRKMKLSYEVIKNYKNAYGNKNILIRLFHYLFGTLTTIYFVKKRRSQIIHINLFGFSLLNAFEIILFRIAGMRIVATIHDIESYRKNVHENKYLYYQILKLINAFIHHSSSSKNAFEKKYPKLINRINERVPHLDFDLYIDESINEIKAKNKLNLDINTTYILFFGQISKFKGIDVLLEAFSELKSDNKVKLIIAGRVFRQSEDYYHNKIKKLGISGNVLCRFMFIPDEDVSLYFKACYLTVLPYQKIYNSSVLIRAMNYGSAIIASDLELFKEILGDNKAGILFSKNNSKELAKKIKLLLNDKNIKEEISIKAKGVIANNYSPEILRIKMSKVYSEVLVNGN